MEQVSEHCLVGSYKKVMLLVRIVKTESAWGKSRNVGELLLMDGADNKVSLGREKGYAEWKHCMDLQSDLHFK